MDSDRLNLTVRVAQQRDLADLVEVLSSSFHPRSGLMRLFLPLLRMGVYEDLRYRLRSSSLTDYVCLVAIATPPGALAGQSQLVGTVEITFHTTYPLQFRSLPYPYLSNLAVRSGSRRQGVAQQLLVASERAVMEQGFQDLYLHVLEDNEQARQLYRKAGYELRQTDDFWWCCLFNQPRKLLLHKRLTMPRVDRLN